MDGAKIARLEMMFGRTDWDEGQSRTALYSSWSRHILSELQLMVVTCVLQCSLAEKTSGDEIVEYCTRRTPAQRHITSPPPPTQQHLGRRRSGPYLGRRSMHEMCHREHSLAHSINWWSFIPQVPGRRRWGATKGADGGSNNSRLWISRTRLVALQRQTTKSEDEESNKIKTPPLKGTILTRLHAFKAVF